MAQEAAPTLFDAEERPPLCRCCHLPKVKQGFSRSGKQKWGCRTKNRLRCLDEAPRRIRFSAGGERISCGFMPSVEARAEHSRLLAIGTEQIKKEIHARRTRTP